MSGKSIEERIVEMQFNNREFESNAKESIDTLGKLEKSLDLGKAADGLNKIDAAGKKLSFAGIAESVSTVADRFNVMGAIGFAAIQKITGAVMDLGAQMIKSLTIDPVLDGFREYELKLGSVQTIMSGSGESLETVNRYLDDLNAYADRTIYSFKDMTQNIGKFTNAGVSLKDSVAAIQGVANVAAISGANTNEASRAMYNFAQALSSGSVKLIDWRSIELANMGTVEFKQQLIDSAVAVGTLTENLDGTYRTMKGKNLSATKGFNDALTDQWMTTDVLVQTLNRYSDVTTDIGRRAAAAAQDVKSFSQLMDTVKESVGSGWAKTFELIIGDFNEAKTLFTAINNVVSGFVDRMSDARNALLEGGLASGWKQLMGEGITHAEDFKTVLAEIATEHGDNISKFLVDEQAFQESLKTGWLTADLMGESISRLAGKFSELSDEEIEQMGYTKDQVEQLRALDEAVKDGTVSLDDYAKKMVSLSGRERLFLGLRNVLQGIASILKPIGDGFRDIFPPMTAERISSIVKDFYEFSKTVKIGDETADKLRRTFAGLFAVVAMVGDGLHFLFNVGKTLFDMFGAPAISSLLDVTARLGDFLVNLRESGVASEGLSKAFGVVKDLFVSVSEAVKDAVDRIRTAMQGFNDIDLGPLDTFADRAGERLRPFEAIGKIFSAAFEVLVRALEWATPIIMKLGSLVGAAFGRLADFISNAVQNMEFGDLVDFINSGVLLAIFLQLKGFVSKLTGVTKDAKGFLESIKGILDGVGDAIQSFVGRTKAETLKTIAIAIAILAASLLVLAMIPTDKLYSGLGALSLIFLQLSLSMNALSKIAGTKNIVKVAGIMTTIAFAILVLSAAMTILAALDWNGILKGVVGIGALTAILVIAAERLSGIKGKIVKGSTSLVIFAAALLVMTQAVKQLGEMDLGSLVKGIVGISALMVAVGIFLEKTKNISGTISTAVGLVVLATALKIMSSAVESLGSLDIGTLIKGLGSIAIILYAISEYLKATGEPSHVISTAIGMTILGAALLIFSEAVSRMGAMPLAQIVKGLLTMGASLLIVSKAMSLMPKDMVVNAIGLIGVAAALVIMAGALETMGGMSLQEIGNGLILLGGSLFFISVAMKAMTGSIAGSAAMLVMAVALAVLAPSLKILGSMDIWSIGQALLTLAGVFTIVGLAAFVLAPLTPVILALAQGILLLGVAVLAIGAGLLLFSAGLSALAVSGTAGAAALVIAVSAIIGLIPKIAEQIALAIVVLAEGVIQGAPAVAAAIFVFVASIVAALISTIPMVVAGAAQLIVSIIQVIATFGPQIIVVAVQLIVALLDAIAASMPALINAGINIMISFINGMADGIRDNTDAILSAVKNLMSSIIEFAIAALAELVGLIPVVGGKMKEGLLAAKEKVREVLAPESMAEIGAEGAKGLGAGIDSQNGSVSEAGKTLGEAGADGMKDGLGSAEDAGADAAGSFSDGLSSALPDASSAGLALGDTSLDSLLSNISGFGDAGSTMGMDFSKYLGETTPSAADAGQGLGDTSLDSLLGNIDGFGDAGSTMGLDFSTSLGDTSSNAGQAASDVSFAASDRITEAVPEFKKAGSDAGEGFVEGLSEWNFEASIAGAALGQSALDAAKRALDEHSPSKKFAQLGKWADQGLAGGLLKFASLAADASTDVATGVVDSFGDYLQLGSRGDEFAQLGKYTVDGFAKGMTDNTKVATKSATNMASGVLTSLTDFFEIASPSVVTKDEVGRYIVQGIGEGIKEDDSAEKAAKEKASQIVEAFQAEFDKLDLNLLTMNLEDQLWEFMNPRAPAGESTQRQLASMSNTLATHLEKIKLAQGEYNAMIEHFGEASEEAQTAYNKLLKLQLELTDVTKKSIEGAFKLEIEKGALDLSTKELEDKLWLSMNPKASGAEVALKENKQLADQLFAQSDKVRLTQLEYAETVKYFGETSVEAQQAYNKLLQEQINLSDLINKAEETKRESGKGLGDSATKYAKWMAENRKELEQAGVDADFIEQMARAASGYDPDKLQAVDTGLEKAIGVGVDTLGNTYQKEAEGTFGGIIQNFIGYGESYAYGMAEGLANSAPTVLMAAETYIADPIDAAMRAQQPTWEDSAKFLVQGFAIGIEKETPVAVQAAIDMATSALNAALFAIGAASPAKKFIDMGMYADQGFAVGLTKFSHISELAAEKVGTNAIDGIRSSIQQMSKQVNGEFNLNPTIRPIIDLDDVKMGVRKVDSLLAKQQGLSVDVSYTQAQRAAARQKDISDSRPSISEGDTNIEFVQNNYSPKALSRLDIYRQTNNQISKVKGMVSA